jgi:hypothetical protein
MAFEGAKIKLKPGGNFSAKLAYGELGLTVEQQRERAIADIKSFVGEERFDLLVQCIKYEGRKPRNLRMLMGFLMAFEGYPATVMLKRYHPRYVRMFGVDGRGRNVVPLRP